MLKKILLGVVVVICLLLIVASFQPSAFRVERSTQITAPVAGVFAEVNDFHKWKAWSPWAKLDPAMTETFEGPSSGVGAVYSWTGNSKVGAGRMTIAESRPDELMRIKLEFLKPFQASNTAEFSFKPAGQETLVTWSMTGQNNFMFKAVGLFMSMDKMVGGDFEKGLASLKLLSATQVKK